MNTNKVIAKILYKSLRKSEKQFKDLERKYYNEVEKRNEIQAFADSLMESGVKFVSPRAEGGTSTVLLGMIEDEAMREDAKESERPKDLILIDKLLDKTLDDKELRASACQRRLALKVNQGFQIHQNFCNNGHRLLSSVPEEDTSRHNGIGHYYFPTPISTYVIRLLDAPKNNSHPKILGTPDMLLNVSDNVPEGYTYTHWLMTYANPS